MPTDKAHGICNEITRLSSLGLYVLLRSFNNAVECRESQDLSQTVDIADIDDDVDSTGDDIGGVRELIASSSSSSSSQPLCTDAAQSVVVVDDVVVVTAVAADKDVLAAWVFI